MAQSNGSIVPAPAPLEIDNPSMVINNLKLFKNKFNLYLRANDLDAKPEKLKVAILLSVIGDDAYELLETLNITEDCLSTEIIFKTLKEYYEPRYNVVVEQFKFFRRDQEEAESFDKFLREIKMIAKRCEFGALEDNMVKVRIVLGVRNLALQERLLRVPDLSLDKTIEHCKSAETAKFQQTLLHNQVAEVNYTVMKNETTYQRQGGKEKEKANGSRVKSSLKEEYDCKKCGCHHGPRNCPAYGKKCNDCGKLNHFKVGCKEKQYNTMNSEGQSNEVIHTDFDHVYYDSSSKPQ